LQNNKNAVAEKKRFYVSLQLLKRNELNKAKFEIRNKAKSASFANSYLTVLERQCASKH